MPDSRRDSREQLSAQASTPAARPDESAVASAYDRWSATYDDDRNRTRDLDAQVVRAAHLPVEGATAVELGCGTGKNTEWLAAHARRVVAMDLSVGMLQRARARVPAPHVTFVRGDVRDAWPVGDASIDVVIGNLVLEHVASLDGVFAEAARVLRPGGSLFLCELHPFRQWRGGQARFTDAATGETVHVAAHVHTVGEYVNGGIAAGLTLRHLGEWLEEDAPTEAPPRLLSARFTR